MTRPGIIRQLRRQASAVGTATSGGVLLVAIGLSLLGVLALVIALVLHAIAPLLGAAFTAWYADARPVRTVGLITLVPITVAAIATLPLLLRAHNDRDETPDRG